MLLAYFPLSAAFPDYTHVIKECYTSKGGYSPFQYGDVIECMFYFC